MTEEQHPYLVPTQPTIPAPTRPETATETKPGPGRTRRWLAGAMLVTVGLVAGSGTTYAFTSDPGSGTGAGTGQGLRGYGFPDGGPDGRLGTPPGSTGTGSSTTDDEPA